MKKYLNVFGILSAIIVLISFGVVLWRGYFIVDPSFHGDPAPGYFVTTLAELEDRASHVIMGRVKNDSFTAYSSKDRAIANAVSIEVIDVIKGNIVTGSVIKILEPYFIKNYVLFSYGNYLPSKANREYFFFLGEQIIGTSDRPAPEGCDEAYWVTHGERGRYLVPENGRLDAKRYSRNALSLGEKSIDIYMRFYQSVIDNYIKGAGNKSETLIEPRAGIVGKPEDIVIQGPLKVE